MTQKLSQNVVKKQNMPIGWTWVRLGDVLKLEYGKGLVKSKRDSRGKIPVYGSSGIVGYHSTPLISEPCIIIGRKGAAGKVHLSNVPSWPIDTAYYISPTDAFDLDFLYFLLRSMRLTLLDTSTAVPSLIRSQVYDMIIPVPPIMEQKQIASKINKLFLNADTKLETIRKTKLQLKQYQNSVLKFAFDGTLTKIFQKEIKDKFFPWKTSKIEDICTKLIGGGTPSRVVSEFFGGKIIWLTPTEIPRKKILTVYDSQEKITDKGLAKSSAKIIPKGAVLLTSRATIGNVAIAGCDVTTNQGFASFVCSDKIYNRYLAYWLWSNKALLSHKAKGTTFKEISKSKLKEIEIPLPSIDEQYFIISKIDEIFSKIEVISESLRKAAIQLIQYKHSVLMYASEGKLVPQNPYDESSKLLIDKIKKENKLEIKAV